MNLAKSIINKLINLSVYKRLAICIIILILSTLTYNIFHYEIIHCIAVIINSLTGFTIGYTVGNMILGKVNE